MHRCRDCRDSTYEISVINVYVNIKYFTKKNFFLYDEGNNHNFYSNVVPSYLHGSKHRKFLIFFFSSCSGKYFYFNFTTQKDNEFY